MSSDANVIPAPADAGLNLDNEILKQDVIM
jgi:hypothetical protein